MARRSRYPGTGLWEQGSPEEQENDGFGRCNTGSGLPHNCVLGGIGCDMDHVTMRRRLSGVLRNVPPRNKERRVYKFGTGDPVPKDAVYLTTLVEEKQVRISAGGETRTERLVWHYFIVEVSGDDS